MKLIYYGCLSVLIAGALFIGGQRLIRHFSAPDIAISIRDTPESYRFKATFPEEKSLAITQAIGKELYPEVSFAGRNIIKEHVLLGDSTRFVLSAAPGYLEIHASKQRNTMAGFARVKKLCERLSELIGSSKLN